MKILIALLLFSTQANAYIFSDNHLTKEEEATLEDYEIIRCGVPTKIMGFVSYNIPYGQCKKRGGYVVDFFAKDTEYEKNNKKSNKDWSH